MSAGCDKKSTRTSTIPCCTPCAAPGIACALRSEREMADSVGHLEDPAERFSSPMAATPGAAPAPETAPVAAGGRRAVAGLVRAARRLVRTHAFRLAGLYFLVFAASVMGVLFFVYWTSADFVERQTEATLDAEITGLAEQYAQRGLSGLVQIVEAHRAGDRGDGMLYLVTNRDGQPLAGNIADWPTGVPVRAGSLSFQIDVPGKGRSETHPARGTLFTIPD